jgi:hypothetical protein
VPGIHVFGMHTFKKETWMAGRSPAITQRVNFCVASRSHVKNKTVIARR